MSDIFEVISYDIWGNKVDGFEVNQSFYTGIDIEIGETATDKDILKALKEVNFLAKTAKFKCFEIEGDFEHTLYVSHNSTNLGYFPFCELRRKS